MRILHCIPDLEGGGAERQLCYLAQGLIERGHQVDVAIMKGGVNGERLRRSGATVHTLGWSGPFSPRLLLDLCGLIRRSGADVVQTWLRRMDVVGGAAALLTGRPWVFSERSVHITDGWREALRQRSVALAAAVVANSDEGGRGWRAALGPRGAVHVIPNALPLAEIAETAPASRRDLDLPEDGELILFVGRFGPEKGIELLADTLAEVLAARPRAHALCCGTGDLLETFRASIARRGLGARCRAPGYRQDAWALMKAADVVISTSNFEGRPNVLLEAMACGAPLAITDIPQHREFIPQEGALYFPPRDRAAAAAALQRALDDRPGAAERAARAAALVRAMSVDAMAGAYERVYRDLRARSA